MGRPRSPTLVTLGRMVRTFRDAAGVTQKELAGRLGYTNGWLSNLETAQLRPRAEQVTAIEQALGLPPGALMNVYEQLDGESLPGWWRPWLDEEKRASVIKAFELDLVPGLLQTPGYAGAVLDGDEAAVQARIDRQTILTREDPPPPKLYVVLDESVLHQGRGGPKVMRDQLGHLVASVGPRLSIQVVPSAVNPRSHGAFMIAGVDGGEVGYVETAVRGIVTSSREDLEVLSASWEEIRTCALSRQESVALVRRVMEEL